MRLKRVLVTGPGLTRWRRGSEFVYVDAGGTLVTDEAVLERISALVLPPAWQDVWICLLANGHVQATGVDAKGRRQYRYHDEWRRQQDLAKHDRILDFADRLPAARERIRADLCTSGLTRTRVLACAVRLLDLGFFRIGGETVMAAVGLAVSTLAETPTARKRAVTRVVQEVAAQLGNTPAVCRASYIDPRLFDLYADGVTIAPQLESLGDQASYGSPAFQGAIGAAVLDLLREPAASRLAS